MKNKHIEPLVKISCANITRPPEVAESLILCILEVFFDFRCVWSLPEVCGQEQYWYNILSDLFNLLCLLYSNIWIQFPKMHKNKFFHFITLVFLSLFNYSYQNQWNLTSADMGFWKFYKLSSIVAYCYLDPR